jgi:uncharacterized RDD family membrane protein YckC
MAYKLNLPKEATFNGPAVFWKRGTAFLIDIFILDFIIGGPFNYLLSRIMPNEGLMENYNYILSNPQLTMKLSLIVITFGFLALLYFALTEYITGQTLGKMLLNIRVEYDSKEKSLLGALLRSMFLILIFPFVLLWIIDPVFMIFTKDKRRLSEIISKTRTIETYYLNGG